MMRARRDEIKTKNFKILKLSETSTRSNVRSTTRSARRSSRYTRTYKLQMKIGSKRRASLRSKSSKQRKMGQSFWTR